ncbi:ectoine synthase [Zobellella sp. DQSA1]|uniref:ectoine synthase n=1 Tax=Zobellella sp. DQSA1 TaxID=3342386 RepID=UPI0035C08044
MIIRRLHDAEKSERRVVSEGWESTRLLLKNDNMGFSFHITTIYAGSNLTMHYRNHLESVYCLAGSGEVESAVDGKVYPIEAGTLYILDQHDKHILRANIEMKMACVFNPPLHGKEVHDSNGVYPITAEAVLEQ